MAELLYPGGDSKTVTLVDLNGNPIGTLLNPLNTLGGGGGGGGGPVTIIDGGDVAQGSTLDTAVSPTIMGRFLKLISLLPAALVGGKLDVNVGATVQVDVADEDTRILGRVKVFDATGAVITVAKDSTLTDGSQRTRVQDSGGVVIDPATKTVQTDGTQKSIVRGGAKGSTAAGDVTSTSLGANRQLLDMAIYNATGGMVDPTQIRGLNPASDSVNIAQWINSAAPTVGQKAMAASLPVVMPSDQWPDAQARAIYYRPRKLNTYRWPVRLAARPYALSNAFGAAGRKQYVTIFHAGSPLKLVKLRHVWVWIESASAAGLIVAELIRLSSATTPATGNPAITAALLDGSFGAPEAVVLALPTTAGTEVGTPWGYHEWNLGITAAGTTVNPPPPLTPVDLVPMGASSTNDEEGMYPQMRAANVEGWAVTLDASAALTAKAFIIIEATEE